MSKYRNGIVDLTENFESVGSAGYEVQLPEIIVLPGKYNGNSSNNIYLGDTDIRLSYNAIIQIPNTNIKWNDKSNKYDGISIILLKYTTVRITNELRNMNFLFFSFLSTFSIGSLTLTQVAENNSDSFPATIEICQTNFSDLSKINNSVICITNTKCADNRNFTYDIFKIQSTNYSLVRSTTFSDRINDISIYLAKDMSNLNKAPTCPKNSKKCWFGGEYYNGVCLLDNKVFSTFPKVNGNNVDQNFKQMTKSDGLNVWYYPELDPKICQDPPKEATELKSKDDVNDLVGRGITNLKMGTDKMAGNAANLRYNILNIQEKIEKQKMDIGEKAGEITNTQEMIERNRRIINNKMNILESRNRQLENSIDRNIYWKKVLYVLFAVIIAIIVLLLLITSFTSNKSLPSPQ